MDASKRGDRVKRYIYQFSNCVTNYSIKLIVSDAP